MQGEVGTGVGEQEGEIIEKRYREPFRGAGKVLYLDLGGGYTSKNLSGL